MRFHTLRHGCSHVNLLHIFRKIFPKNTPTRLLLLFVLAYTIVANAADNETGIKDKKYFLPRRKIENYNVLIDRRSFYDQLMI